MTTEKKKALKPQFYFRWGNEPTGKVSTGAYDHNDVYRFTGELTENEAKNKKLYWHCPHS